VLLAVCREFKIESDVIPQIATCFGGGIGNSGNICGAVAGAVMAIGLVRKQSTTVDEWLETAEVAREFCRRFEEKMGTMICRELTKLDLTSKEAIEGMMNSEVAMTVCFPAVATAFEITMDLLKDQK